MLHFKEFVESVLDDYQYSDMEVANLYFGQPEMKVAELAEKTGRTIAELYQIIHSWGKPNRLKNRHHHVHVLSDSGLPNRQVAELTGYSERQVRNILKTEGSND